MDALQQSLQQIARALASAVQTPPQSGSAVQKQSGVLPSLLITPPLPPSTFETLLSPPVNNTQEITASKDDAKKSSVLGSVGKLFWMGSSSNGAASPASK